jgi:hypothetical protein
MHSNLFGILYYIVQNMFSSGLIRGEIGVKIIGEKIDFQYSKNNKKFYEYNNP